MIKPRRGIPILLAAASLGLAACGDDGGNLEELDKAGQELERKADEAQKELERMAEEAGEPAPLPTAEP